MPSETIQGSLSAPDAKKNARYMPYLDGLRAIALFAVLVSHFAYDRNWLHVPSPEWGRLGVDLFFVLSGFLITQILLRYRDASHNFHDVTAHLRTFYIRRSLRIFPIYYLTIAVAALLGYEPVRNYLWWHLTYTSNIAVSLFHIEFEAVNHFWTLCIEEQFYLLWPWVVLLVPRKGLRYVIFGLIAFGVASRALPLYNFPDMGRVLPTRIDVLSIGALLALYWHEPLSFRRERLVLFWIGLLIGLPLTALYVTQAISPRDDLRDITRPLVELGAALFFMALINAAAQPKPWRILKPLGWAPLRYIGKISYGVYVYHLFVKLLMSNLYEMLFHQKFQYGVTMVIVDSLASILLASLSWYVIEHPINKLKERIQDKKTQPSLQKKFNDPPTGAT